MSITPKKITLVCLTVFFSFVLIGMTEAWQGQVTVESKLDKSTVTVGELVKYEIIIKFSQGMQVATPPAGINLGGFEIKDYEDPDPVERDGMIEKRVEFTIAAYDTGNFVIPPTGIAYLTDDSVGNTLFTDAVNIRVESVLDSASQDILDIKQNLEVPRSFMMFIFIGIGVLIAIIAFMTWYYYRKYRKKGGSLFDWKEPDRPAHETAFEALKELKESTLLEEGMVKEYYIILSDILRHYLQNRYFIPVMEKTTGETIALLEGQNIETSMIEKTQNLLTESDFVKFAKYHPGPEQHEKLFDLAYEIVDSTKIIEFVTPEENPEESLPEGETQVEEIQIVDDNSQNKLPESTDKEAKLKEQ